MADRLAGPPGSRRDAVTADATRLAGLLVEAGAGGTVVFSGAGVSTESGIPDFRSPGGLWTRYAPIGYREFLADPARRQESWRRGLHTYAAIVAAAPNPAHRAVAQWWQAGLVTAVVTQNIDGLHQRAGLPESAVVELHGTSHRVQCLACAAVYDRPSVEARVLAGEADPACPACGGILKAMTISFGQPLAPETVAAAERLLATARLCLIVGSSLVVYPAAGLPRLTLAAGGVLAIVNASATPLDGLAAVVSRQPAGQVLDQAARLVRATRA